MCFLFYFWYLGGNVAGFGTIDELDYRTACYIYKIAVRRMK